MAEYGVERPFKREPVHPGEIVREDVLPALKLTVSEAARRLGERWTPSFGQPGSGVKVDSMRFVMLPFGERIPPSAFCHRRGSSEVVPRCSM